MGLANYFSKNLLAINRLISSDLSALEDILENSVVTIAFDKNCAETYEGEVGIEMLVRLIARLYPKIKIVDLSGTNSFKRKELIELSKRINTNIEVLKNKDEENIYIIAGHTNETITTNGTKIYFGADNWVSKYSITDIQSFGNSNNPFGSSIAACIASSNIFRHVFNDYIHLNEFDEDFQFSVFNLSTNITSIDFNPKFPKFKLKDFTIVGLGAIGNGLVWALSKINNLEGRLNLVDKEEIALSNVQRYVLTNQSSEDDVKVELAKVFLDQTNLQVDIFKNTWEEYLSKTNDWNIEHVAVAIDNIKDRIGIQSSLPKIIFNAFTEPESTGITRHTKFSKEACLMCSNIPSTQKRNWINEVADNCRIPSEFKMVKDYYNLNLPVGTPIPNSQKESLLLTIAKANNIEIEELSAYGDMTVEKFYSDFVCGGVILHKSELGDKITNVDAPLAFQSAMAGIFLAAEMVKFSIGIETSYPRTDFYHLTKISEEINPFNRMIQKDDTGRCICSDPVFIDRYNSKWT